MQVGIVLISIGAVSNFGQSTLSVNPSAPGAVVRNEIFGGLMEKGLGRGLKGGIFCGTDANIPHVNGLRQDVIDGFKEVGFGALQWPGGCAAHNYEWDRQLNPSNDIGTDRFMQFCQLVGCEPILTGTANSSWAPSNKAWLDYVNRNEDHPDWNVKYFQLGNEVWGCGGNYGSWGAYKPNYDANYDAIRGVAQNDDVELIAGTDGIWRFEPWLKEMLQAEGNRIELIEIHDYIYFPDPPDGIDHLNFTDAQYYDICNRANESQMKPRLDQIISILDQYDPEGKILIWEGEWGNWLIDDGTNGWRQAGTLLDALSAGETLNLFIRYAKRMMGAGLAQVVNVIHSIMNTESATGALVKTPTFYVFKMYLSHHRNNAKTIPFTLNSERVSNMPAISAATTVDDSIIGDNKVGNVNVSLTNIDLSQERTVNMTLSNVDGDWTCFSANVVTGPQKNSYNNYGQSEAVTMKPLAEANVSKTGERTFTVKMPAKSIAMLRFRRIPTSVRTDGTAAGAGTSFSIRPENGRVLVSSTVNMKTPVTVTMYSVDGRTLITSGAIKAGSSACTLEKLQGKGVYLVNVAGTGVSVTKKVVLTK